MFDLIPFGRKEKDLYRYFNDFEKSFFGDSGSYLSAFKTDIIDKDGAYVLQAELPGFFVLYIGPSGKVQYRDKLLYLY